MASTYSKLKIELIGDGEQAGQWGVTTNNNLGSSTAGVYRGLEQAIVGMATLETADFTSNVYTLSYDNDNAAQDFRALVLNITATLSAAGTVNVPAIQKPYIVMNNSVGGYAVTVKVSGLTGVSVPNGKTMWVYNNGTDVVDAVTHLSSLTLSSALPVASGGTGITSFGTGVATWLGTPSSANLRSAVTDETGSGSLVFATSPTLVTPLLGTPTSGTLTNCTGLPLSTGVTGQLPLANGGTGANLSDPNADRILFWDDSAGAMAFLTAGTGLTISGTTITASGGGTGDVTGPASSGDENIARFNGTTGKIIEDSGVVCKTPATGNFGIGVSGILSNASFAGTGNTAIGRQIGTNITTGQDNVLVGTVIDGISTGQENVGFGLSLNFKSAVIGNVLLGSDVSLDNLGESGSVVVGYALSGQGTGTGVYGGANGVYNEANTASWSTISDERIKKNIVDSPVGLAQINQLQVRNYNYKTNEEMPLHEDGKPFAKNLDTSKTITGFIAQEIQQVMPCCVRENERGVLSVNTENVLFALVNAVKELSAEVEALKAQLS